MKLDGFANTPREIDGTIEEDLEAYNYCLAYEYYCAVVNEDFDSLGEDLNDVYAWYQIMNKVLFWLATAETEQKEYLNNIYNGTIITNKDRTFIEACKKHGWNELANSLSSKNHCFKKIKR